MNYQMGRICRCYGVDPMSIGIELIDQFTVLSQNVCNVRNSTAESAQMLESLRIHHILSKVQLKIFTPQFLRFEVYGRYFLTRNAHVHRKQWVHRWKQQNETYIYLKSSWTFTAEQSTHICAAGKRFRFHWFSKAALSILLFIWKQSTVYVTLPCHSFGRL